MTHILSERRGTVGIITINRPARFNAMDVHTAQDFRRVSLQFARDAEIRGRDLSGDGNRERSCDEDEQQDSEFHNGDLPFPIRWNELPRPQGDYLS